MEIIFFTLQYSDQIFTFVTLIISIYLFLNNPIRRWKLFGFRPTLIAVLIDKDTKNTVIVREDTRLSFPQQTINSEDIADELRELLDRELGLDSSQVEVKYFEVLGTVKNYRKVENEKSKRILGGISFRKNIVGKGYIACFCACKLKNDASFKTAIEVDEVTVLDYKQALKLLYTNSKKDVVYKRIEKELSKLIVDDLK